MAEGDAIIVRYADDFVVGFQYRRDAERFLRALKGRLGRFGLELHPFKTRLIEFGRFAKANRAARQQGKPETFDFLGMTHFCDQSQKGWFRVGRMPAKKRVARTLKRIAERLRRIRHRDQQDVARWLGRIIRGWLNYYAVPGSFRFLKRFVWRVLLLFRRALRRRSHRYRSSWARVDHLVKCFWPRVTIIHPWPDRRLTVNYSR